MAFQTYPRGYGHTSYLQLVSDSTALIVATTDIKRQVNLPSTDHEDDVWIGGAIRAARRYVEHHSRRAMLNQTWDYVLDGFPPSNYPLRLPKPPLSSITSISYYDGTNSSTTLATSDYSLHKPTDGQAYLRPPVDGTWPTTRTRDDAVTIRMVVGYGAQSANVPDTYKHAIKMLVGHWYENRESVVVGTITKPIEHAVDALINSEAYGFYG